MPRTHVRKTVPSYDPNKLKELAELVKVSKRSIGSVAREHNVPKETLRRWVIATPTRTGSGGINVLSVPEEDTIVSALEFASECGYPQGRNEVKDMVKSYIESIGRKTPFHNNRPGEDWMKLFEMRHRANLKRRKPEILTLARAKGLTKEVVDSFFEMYEQKLEENGLSDQPQRIFNLDETGLTTNRVGEAVYVRRETKDAYIKSPNAGKKRARVQATVGEVLTEEESLERLKREADNRAKKIKDKRPKTSNDSETIKTKPAEKQTLKEKPVAKMNRKLMYVDETDCSESESDSSTTASVESDNEADRQALPPVRAADLLGDEKYVLVDYEGSCFPGKVVSLKKKRVTVSCMTKSSLTSWKWPDHEDVHDYTLSDIKQVINPPTPCGSRGQWNVPEVARFW